MLIACVKVGTLYGPEYVNRLAAMVDRHTTRSHRFVCLTDDPSGLACASIPIDTDLPGWWAKLALFRPGTFGERVIYLDLDTVICANIDFLFDYSGPFAMLRSFLPPSRYGSAVMSFLPGHGYLWQDFTRNVMNRLYGDQDWIAERVSAVDCWQDVAPGRIGSYKVDELQDGPRDFAICCFHGEPKPHKVTDGWVEKMWSQATWSATLSEDLEIVRGADGVWRPADEEPTASG